MTNWFVTICVHVSFFSMSFPIVLSVYNLLGLSRPMSLPDISYYVVIAYNLLLNRERIVIPDIRKFCPTTVCTFPVDRQNGYFPIVREEKNIKQTLRTCFSSIAVVYPLGNVSIRTTMCYSDALACVCCL